MKKEMNIRRVKTRQNTGFANSIVVVLRCDDDAEDCFKTIRSKNHYHLAFGGGLSTAFDGVSFTVNGDTIRFSLYCEAWGGHKI